MFCEASLIKISNVCRIFQMRGPGQCLGYALRGSEQNFTMHFSQIFFINFHIFNNFNNFSIFYFSGCTIGNLSKIIQSRYNDGFRLKSFQEIYTNYSCALQKFNHFSKV